MRPHAAGPPAIPGSAQSRMTSLGVMVLGNYEAGQVAHCGQADCYGSDTQTIAILCRLLIRTTCSPFFAHVTTCSYSNPHLYPSRLSPARLPSRTRASPRAAPAPYREPPSRLTASRPRALPRAAPAPYREPPPAAYRALSPAPPRAASAPPRAVRASPRPGRALPPGSALPSPAPAPDPFKPSRQLTRFDAHPLHQEQYFVYQYDGLNFFVEDLGFVVDLGAYSAPKSPRSPFLPRSFMSGTHHSPHVHHRFQRHHRAAFSATSARRDSAELPHLAVAPRSVHRPCHPHRPCR